MGPISADRPLGFIGFEEVIFFLARSVIKVEYFMELATQKTDIYLAIYQKQDRSIDLI